MELVLDIWDYISQKNSRKVVESIDQSNKTKLVAPSIEKITNCGVFVHNLGTEDTAANGARCSTLARPVCARIDVLNPCCA